MAGFNLTINMSGQDKLTAMKALLSPATFAKAQKGGTNYAAKAAPPAIAKAVGARYSMKAKDIKGDISKPRLADGGTTAIIRLSRRPRTAAAFSGRLSASGYSFAIFKGKRSSVLGGFEGTFNGVRLPYYRTGAAKRAMKKGRYQGKIREPITVISGVSLGSMFLGNSRFGDVMQKEVGERMQQQFLVGVDRELKRAARGF